MSTTGGRFASVSKCCAAYCTARGGGEVGAFCRLVGVRFVELRLLVFVVVCCVVRRSIRRARLATAEHAPPMGRAFDQAVGPLL